MVMMRLGHITQALHCLLKGKLVHSLLSRLSNRSGKAWDSTGFRVGAILLLDLAANVRCRGLQQENGSPRECRPVGFLGQPTTDALVR